MSILRHAITQSQWYGGPLLSKAIVNGAWGPNTHGAVLTDSCTGAFKSFLNILHAPMV
jgi:hypothetical protein